MANTDKLLAAAKTGNLDALKTAVDAAGDTCQTCQTCHDN